MVPDSQNIGHALRSDRDPAPIPGQCRRRSWNLAGPAGMGGATSDHEADRRKVEEAIPGQAFARPRKPRSCSSSI